MYPINFQLTPIWVSQKPNFLYVLLCSLNYIVIIFSTNSPQLFLKHYKNESLVYNPKPLKKFIMRNYNNIKSILSATLFVALFCFAGNMQAKCTYNKVIEGKEFGIGIMLKWSTSIEINNAMFVIERSTDGVDYENIGNVNGKGTTENVSEYNFLDVNASKSKLYYRLKQMDIDGSFSYSDIIALDKKIANNFMVVRMSAASADDLFETTINAFESKEMKMTVTDWKGNVLMDDMQKLQNGLNSVMVDLSDMKPAIYKVTFEVEDEVETLTFRKKEDEFARKPNMASKNKMKGRN